MRSTPAWPLVALLWTLIAATATAVDYTHDVKPILQRHCYSCHGALQQQSGLRLDHPSFIQAGGDRGASFDAAGGESILLAAVRGTGDVERMPLEAEPLSDEQVATLAAWIDEGAQAPDEPLPPDPREHWSFTPPVRPALPKTADSKTAHPVDRFLAAERQRRGLPTAPEADKHVLLRRVYLDLVGLPPTPSELRAFLADTSDVAYEKVVDRLLASPRYGERWGRHWMDVWRYSDWDGYKQEVRESQPHIWRWRDWIVESLNADKPYDAMIREMLAADELAPADPAAERATGFLVRNWYKFNRNVWLDSTVEHTAKAFLGITLNCARCHDHMYDPIPQTEYYAFRAFFEPHQVRTDRVPNQSDTAQDGLVHVYDADVEAPTFLYTRGNEAQPEKENPLAPAVPDVLGGDPLVIEPVALPAEAFYPGIREFVRRETLDQAQAELEGAETAMAAAHDALRAARDQRANALAASGKPDSKSGDQATASPKPVSADASGEQVDAAKPGHDSTALDRLASKAALAASKMLAASAKLTAVRAQLAADQAAFATPPAADANRLAREASRAQRVHDVEQARYELLRREDELAAARQMTDKSAKKKVAAAAAAVTKAKKAHEAAQAALGKATAKYRHTGKVYPRTSSGRRAALARWIASRNNPLTARVAVNQIWMRHFGTPLVPSVFDFGLNGKPPTHPELLDWLAVELIEQGWRMKALHRLLVTSAAYRMRSSFSDPAAVASDPENQFLWRAHVRRMEAEVVRDSTLHVAGALDPTMGGPDLDPEQGMTLPRRSIYFRSSKEKKMTFLDMFDSANVTDCYRRSETIVPQQALAMVNSQMSVAQARRLAATLSAELPGEESADDETAFVDAAFERVLCRPATEAERSLCLKFLDRQAARFADPSALQAFTTGDANPHQPAADPRQRARENLLHVLLNHNDFVTVR